MFGCGSQRNLTTVQGEQSGVLTGVLHKHTSVVDFIHIFPFKQNVLPIYMVVRRLPPSSGEIYNSFFVRVCTLYWRAGGNVNANHNWPGLDFGHARYKLNDFKYWANLYELCELCNKRILNEERRIEASLPVTSDLYCRFVRRHHVHKAAPSRSRLSVSLGLFTACAEESADLVSALAQTICSCGPYNPSTQKLRVYEPGESKAWID